MWAGARPRNPWGPSSLSIQEAQDLGGGRSLGRTARGGSRLCPGLGGQSDSGQQYLALLTWPVHLGRLAYLEIRGGVGRQWAVVRGGMRPSQPPPTSQRAPLQGAALGRTLVPLHWGGQQGAIGRWVGTQAGKRPPAMSRCPGGSELPPAGPQHLQPPHRPPEGWP